MYELLLLIAAAVLLVGIYYGARKRNSQVHLAAVYVVGAICAVTAIGVLSATPTSATGIFLAVAATMFFGGGTARLIARHKRRPPHWHNEVANGPARRQYERDTAPRHVPWKAWGFAYIVTSIGAAVVLAHTKINPGSALSISLWALWGLLFLFGAIGAAFSWARNEKPEATIGEILLCVLKVPLLLGSVLVPGAIYAMKPYSEKHQARAHLSYAQKTRLLIIWSLWGLLCALLWGIYKDQAVGFVLFGAIFLVPAMIGWARFQGIVE